MVGISCSESSQGPGNSVKPHLSGQPFHLVWRTRKQCTDSCSCCEPGTGRKDLRNPQGLEQRLLLQAVTQRMEGKVLSVSLGTGGGGPGTGLGVLRMCGVAHN